MAGDNLEFYTEQLRDAEEPDLELGRMDDMLSAITGRLDVWESEADDDDVTEEAKAKIRFAQLRMGEAVAAIRSLMSD